jgi:hypothetical protein
MKLNRKLALRQRGNRLVDNFMPAKCLRDTAAAHVQPLPVQIQPVPIKSAIALFSGAVSNHLTLSPFYDSAHSPHRVKIHGSHSYWFCGTQASIVLRHQPSGRGEQTKAANGHLSGNSFKPSAWHVLAPLRALHFVSLAADSAAPCLL